MILLDISRSAFGGEWCLLRLGPLRGCADPFEEEKAAHIVDDIGQSDPHGGACYPDVTDALFRDPRSKHRQQDHGEARLAAPA